MLCILSTLSRCQRSSRPGHGILELVSQKGLLRARDLDVIAAPRVVLTRLTAAGLLERIGRGLYRLPESEEFENESFVTIATKVPQAVFCSSPPCSSTN